MKRVVVAVSVAALAYFVLRRQRAPKKQGAERAAVEIVDFESAVEAIAQNSEKVDCLSNEEKLCLYGLYKQSKMGPNTSAQPLLFDTVARAKWEAWKGLGNMPVDEAQRVYVELAIRVIGGNTEKAKAFGPVFSQMQSIDGDLDDQPQEEAFQLAGMQYRSCVCD
jgi:acyl-CoA-binding protein